MSIKCIIIEDEKAAQEILASFISRVEWLELLGTFDDALGALDFIKKNDPDLILLDIQIPGISGIDFLKTLKKSPQVIITSAYSEYALEAFELDVRDYLMKPFSFERFLKAANKISPRVEPAQIYQINDPLESKNSFAFFNVSKKMVKVLFTDILYVESMREYVAINTGKDRVITKMSITEMEKILGPGYLRIHRSFIVSTAKVTAFTAEEMFIDKLSLPIGPNYKRFIELEFGRQPQG
jgi:two-component system LytT family response regulator